MPPPSAQPTLPSEPTFPDATLTEKQLEELISSEFKTLLSCKRFNQGRPNSRFKHLIFAFESLNNAINVNSFCSRHNISRTFVFEVLARLVSKKVHNGTKEPSEPVTLTQFPDFSELVTNGYSNDDWNREAVTDSHEKKSDVPLVKNVPILIDPNKDQDAIQSLNQGTTPGTPGQKIEAPVVAPTVPEVVYPPVTPLKTPDNGGKPVQSKPALQGVGEEDYNKVPIYTPLPVLIGGTALEINNGPLLNPKPSTGKKDTEAISKSIPRAMATGSNLTQSLNKQSPNTKKSRLKSKLRKENLAISLNPTAKPSKKKKKKKAKKEADALASLVKDVKTDPIVSLPLPPRPSFLPAADPPAITPSPRSVLPKSLAKLLNKHKQSRTPTKTILTAAVAAANPFPSTALPNANDRPVSCIVNDIIQLKFPSPETIGLPYPVQFIILTETQSVLEGVCHSFAKDWLPRLTSTEPFLHPESAELSLWVRTMAHPANIAVIPYDALDIEFMHSVVKIPHTGRFFDESSRSLVRLRNLTVHRQNLDCNELHEVLRSAVYMAIFLRRYDEADYLGKIWDKQDELGTNLKKQIIKIRADIKKALEALYHHKPDLYNCSAAVVDIGMERTEKAFAGANLSLADLRALKSVQLPDRDNK
ncbi:hypothetical protein TWF506_010095 [Arthrobotrys conoides]|uniref:Uncharacterized protein n=1 Tax=Arthrobotrys conoides TaxID=74498 RepID=A0AAN8NAZ8_9PEZI